MISKEIEKEIQQENKVILNFTIRQVICLSVALACSILIAVFLGLDFSIAVYPCVIIGILCFMFGWKKQDGLPMERVLLKHLKTYIYQNNRRCYKTKNRYIILFNREYARRRKMDLKDKQIRKQLKREKRKNKAAIKKSQLKRIL